jgi:hypothetical protein
MAACSIAHGKIATAVNAATPGKTQDTKSGCGPVLMNDQPVLLQQEATD